MPQVIYTDDSELISLSYRWSRMDSNTNTNLDFRILCTINSLMFAGINVCIFKTQPYSQELIFAFSSCLVKLSRYMNYVYEYLFLQFKDGLEFRQINPSQTSMTLSLNNNLGNHYTDKKHTCTVFQNI